MSRDVPHNAEVTRILNHQGADLGRIEDQLLPLVYEELRRLAAARIAAEPAGLTLQSTALVHEAYLRLVGSPEQAWEHRGHFFAAAAEAMRRILVEQARRKKRLKHGGEFGRAELHPDEAAPTPRPAWDILDLEEALIELEQEHPRKVQLVKLRYFAGLNEQEAADALGISRASAARDWTFAKAWLFARLGDVDAV
ncbi:MAG: sigma-70 family RNA polymerase sigma factor [Planctomycetaceae bacterium]|nr:sigma-70 family RNA polymerase sigma factor [Planctomycetaceae bacterium]